MEFPSTDFSNHFLNSCKLWASTNPQSKVLHSSTACCWQCPLFFLDVNFLSTSFSWCSLILALRDSEEVSYNYQIKWQPLPLCAYHPSCRPAVRGTWNKMWEKGLGNHDLSIMLQRLQASCVAVSEGRRLFPHGRDHSAVPLHSPFWNRLLFPSAGSRFFFVSTFSVANSSIAAAFGAFQLKCWALAEKELMGGL